MSGRARPDAPVGRALRCSDLWSLMPLDRETFFFQKVLIEELFKQVHFQG